MTRNIDIINSVLIAGLLWSVLVRCFSHAAPKEVGTEQDFDAGNFLSKFGYLEAKENQSYSEESYKQSIRDYQDFNGLPVTGQIDGATIKKMKQPRCGLPDIIRRPSQLTKGHVAQTPLGFHVSGVRWPKHDLSYKIVSYTRKLNVNQINIAVASALKKWAEVTPLTFRPKQGQVDIEISFSRGLHGDGYNNAFDGKGRTLAHAYFPGPYSINGDAHFDDDEDWTLGKLDGINFEKAAAHEFGHSLGLDHSREQGALMAPSYDYYDGSYKLHSDDIRGIQTLYGPRMNPATTRPTTRSKPRTQSPVTTVRPRKPRPNPTRSPTKPTARPPIGDQCPPHIDAIVQDHRNHILIFWQSHLYTLISQEHMIKRPLNDVIKLAPHAPSAAVYDRHKNKLYIFKGSQYWRYSGYSLDHGYPKLLPTFIWGVTAAVQKNEHIWLFKGPAAYQWSENTAHRASPVRYSQIWRGLPDHLDAAFKSTNGYYYFFKGDKYWRYDARTTLSPGYPKNIKEIIRC